MNLVTGGEQDSHAGRHVPGDPDARKGKAETRRPFVSIIITSYNFEDFVGSAIDSALAQTHREREVIIVDDGSTDGSRGVIERYRDRPGVTTILQQNGGQASAMNAGFAASRGDIVVFLDADDRLKPEAAETVVAHWEPGLSHCQYVLEIIDADDRVVGLHPLAQRMEQGDMHWKLVVGGFFWFMPTSGNAFARQALARIFPIPAEAWRICADVYINALSTAHGPVRNIDKSLGYYRVHNRNNWYRDAVDREYVLANRRHRLEMWRGLTSVITPDGTLAPAQARRAKDYAALHVYRRIVAAYAMDRELMTRHRFRSILLGGIWRALTASLPLRHKFLYLGFFGLVGAKGWRFPAAQRWNAYSGSRPRWLNRLTTYLKGEKFYEWITQRARPSRVHLIVLDRAIEFGAGGNARKYLWYGWDQSDARQSWSYGHEAAFIGRAADTYDLDVEIALSPFLGEYLQAQRLIVLVNGQLITEKWIQKDEVVKFAISRSLFGEDKRLVIVFRFPDCLVPSFVRKEAHDYRPLGFAFRSIRFSTRAIDAGALGGPLAAADRRVAFDDDAAVGYLGEGWHPIVNGVARMASSSAALHMTLLHGSAFDHMIALEFAPEDRQYLPRSTVRAAVKGAAVRLIDTVRDPEACLLIPRNLVPADGKLVVEFSAGNFLPARFREEGYSEASGPGLRAFALHRLPVPIEHPEFVPGQVLNFRAGGSARRFMATGWRASEARGTLTSDVSASLVGVFLRHDREVFLTAVVYPPIDEGLYLEQTLAVLCNGAKVAVYEISERSEITAILPVGLVGDDRVLRIEFQVAFVGRPSDLGLGNDRRTFGIGVEALKLE